ncbi:MAG TPA: YdcF family protein [Acidiferrobacteraceae bacterium]|nr:YdcF family protein [Acidiferrobacteraceae bacterium]
MSLLFSKAVATLLLPPGLSISLLVIGGFVMIRHRRAGMSINLSALLLLYIFSMPVTGKALLSSLERYEALVVDPATTQPGAIVVLGGGYYPKAPEYGGQDTVSGSALERLRYAARLHRQTGIPILLSGGQVFSGDSEPESVVAARALKEDFGITSRWVESRSRNTRENARFSKEVLDPLGVDRIYLVTHAWHMWRGVSEFRKMGFLVIPAPTLFITDSAADRTLLAYLPSAGGLHASAAACHEYLGRLWYALTR